MTKEKIKHIISYEIEVDCYHEEERYMSWAIYMKEHINYPFKADY